MNLATAFLAAWVVTQFDGVVAKIPWLGSIHGHRFRAWVGTPARRLWRWQSVGIAMGEGGPRMIWRVIYRELICGFLTGTAVGFTTWACASLGLFGRDQYDGQPILLGFVICLALAINHVNACVTGVSIPFLMKKMGFDPAQSATIFATTFTDCGGFFATLWLAKVIMHIHA